MYSPAPLCSWSAVSTARAVRTAWTAWTARRFAGHSKWANIKHTKALKDQQKSASFTRLSRYIKVAIQEGNSADPKVNAKLSQVIEQAKRICMPAATINNVIKTSQLNSNKTNCKPGILELRGYGGLIILCEIFTDNLTRTKQHVAAIIKKHYVTFSDGSGQRLFEKKGVLEVEFPKGQSETELMEKAMEHAIESGAEDVRVMAEGVLQFVCHPNDTRTVQKSLENLQYALKNVSVDYIPKLCVSVPENELDNLSVLFDKLESIEDVIKLHDNIG